MNMSERFGRTIRFDAAGISAEFTLAPCHRCGLSGPTLLSIAPVSPSLSRVTMHCPRCGHDWTEDIVWSKLPPPPTAGESRVTLTSHHPGIPPFVSRKVVQVVKHRVELRDGRYVRVSPNEAGFTVVLDCGHKQGHGPGVPPEIGEPSPCCSCGLADVFRGVMP